jgi:hypothetical protein
LIRWRWNGVDDARVLGRYLVLVRFGIEFIRVNQRIVGPLTLAPLIAFGLIVAGTAMLLTVRDRVPHP